LLAGLLLLAGCSGPTKQRWSSFFFDGVPVPGAATNAPRAQIAVGPSQTNAVFRPTPAAERAKLYVHPPYANRQCAECHEARSSQRMAGKGAAVCFACHKDSLAAAKVKHQPVENGECASCHNPHQAYNTNLLAQLPPALCFQCHDPFPKTAKSSHQPVENGECLACHNPHSSDFKGLLLKPDGKLCFECHDDIQQQLARAKVKHQPVENGECVSCHNPHQSDNKKLLLKPGASSAPSAMTTFNNNWPRLRSSISQSKTASAPPATTRTNRTTGSC
jgi:predicted CXXCH cytochrome family protein